ncbi:MAG: thioredoxin family protein [Maricaulaceae bacterium]|nr:thioredoxin family protein [Maricaulaceae bacterium]
MPPRVPLIAAVRIHPLLQALMAVLALLAAPVAAAQTSGAPLVRASLVSEAVEIAPGGEFWVAMRQQITPRWHTYWRNPGDSGEPTQLFWDLPEGFEASDIYWPVPYRYPVAHLANYGYEDDLLLPVRITAPANLRPGDTARLSVHAYWLVCEDICIPEDAVLTLDIPVAAQTTPGRWAGPIRDMLAALPQPWPQQAGFTYQNERVTLSIPGAALSEELSGGRATAAEFFPFRDSMIVHAAPQGVRYGPDGVTVELEAGARFTGRIGGGVDVLDGLLIFREGRDAYLAYEVSAVTGAPAGDFAAAAFAPGAGSGAAAGGGPAIGFFQAVFFALIGGLILNLMPCVFPVLFVKALGFVEQSRAEAWKVRRHGLVFTAGILVSFAILAGVFLALRAAGESIGWGFQLQSPLFVLGVAAVMFAVGLNLSGVFNIGGAAGIGQSLTEKRGLAGSFFTGVLAVVVASPCTAPFMAAALGAALTLPLSTALAIFIALGLGMALPWLALSFSPALLNLLPKPGGWMVRFKQVLAFPMYGAAAWLIWVLAQQTGPGGLAAALGALVLVAFAAWLYEAVRTSSGKGGWRITGAGAAAASLIAAVALAFAVGPGGGMAQAENGSSAAGLEWSAWSEEAVEAARAEGRPVFVNMTAAWCISCLANESVALNRRRVAEAFAEHGVVYLKGDWTNRNAEIARVLEAHGRSGVPLYLYYAPGAERPEVLPQILTEDIILRAVQRGTS